MIHVTKGLVPFWDDYMIDHRFTTAELSVNRPVKTDSVMTFDQPWDGNANDFFTILKDDGFYRMYYEVWSLFDPAVRNGGITDIHVCYAESTDGIHWERPSLGISEYEGSTDNNIIMMNIPDNIVVMKDKNPACLPEHRYKAIMSCTDVSGYANFDPGRPKHGLICKVSASPLQQNTKHLC